MAEQRRIAPAAAGLEEQLVATEADDGLALAGFQMTPVGGTDVGLVWLHGFGVGYDLPECVRLGRDIAARGIGFVSGNLRGHDGAAAGWRRVGDRVEVVQTGSWWEVFEESALDIGAWVRHGRAVGFRRLVLCGHSFGALRAVFYVSQAPAAVDGVVLASLSFGLRHLDPLMAEAAQGLVESGRGEQLLPAGSWPRGFGTDTVSAQTYASWWRVAPGFFGSGRTRFADITAPLLVWYGTAGDVGGRSDLEFITGQATAAASVESVLLPDVRHRYAGAEATIADILANWVDRAVVGEPSGS